MSDSTQPRTIYRSDYALPPYTIARVDLTFELDPSSTLVRARMELQRQGAIAGASLWLDGEGLELRAIALDGQPLVEADYLVEAGGIWLLNPPAQFVLETEVMIHPDQNSALEGLYISSNNFCTQCEAEGFRRISYYLDRPDVMATFTTTIIAPLQFPVLLSNGNRIESGMCEDGRHFAKWHDPFPKPSYLFALVAGDLIQVADRFTTASGREVALEIYVEEGNQDRCDHAMASLKHAMRWDEAVYGREYDLDSYMIVAVNDFNMGAMENKGLNVFNSRYVLAKPETATDADYDGIEAVIAHEYFHNWSGNRVTCRDWFQLSLKEGLTVFRDQQFSADMNSAAVKRIDDVQMLRSYQFAEDAGPMAHPVRPDSYQEINNFYTLTVYEKGAELIRMLHTFLGAERFRRGSDLYFERHDGQAVTCDEWVAALADANRVDLTPFMGWYSQAGTPRLTISRDYDAVARTLTLHVSQQIPSTPGQTEKSPQPIPMVTGLIGPDGAAVPVTVVAKETGPMEQMVLISESTQTITLYDVPPGTVPSLLRNFSAPVRLESDLNPVELSHLMAHDSDPFNRWDAGQQLAERVLQGRYANTIDASLDGGYIQAFGTILADAGLDPALKAVALTLPDTLYLLERIDAVDPQRLFELRQQLHQQLVSEHLPALLAAYAAVNSDQPYRLDAEAKGQRRLKNRLLALLQFADGTEGAELAFRQYQGADNMTDAMAALAALIHHPNAYRDEVVTGFYQRWHTDPLVLDKWFALQATTPLPHALEDVVALRAHPDFNLRNPNRVRSLVGSFAMRNPYGFHRPDGEGYRFLSGLILELDGMNPQVAARMVTPLTQWRRYEAGRQQQMVAELERILACDGLSKDLYEICSKGVAGAA